MKYRLNIRSDIYCKEDLLGFDKYIDALNTMISDRDFKTPFCIGIFGKWGSGKTSFMRLLENKLSEDATEPYTIPVRFNPWRYQREDHLIIPFLKTIDYEISGYVKEHEGIKGTLLGKLKETSAKIGEAAAAFAYGISADAKLGGFGFKLDASKMVTREEELTKKRIDDCLDMSGNVGEWTGSWYDDKKNLSVLRGGSWSFGAYFCRCACRDRFIPGVRYYYTGFRCARTL